MALIYTTADPRPKPLKPKRLIRMRDTDSITLSACGDILLHGRYHTIAEETGADRAFECIRPLLASSDVVVGNMETVLSRKGSPRADKLCLRGDPRYAASLARAGFNVLTLANNHCLDYGPDGLADTRRHLEAAGIGVVGAGCNLREACRPLLMQRNGVRLGFIGACHASTKPAPAATSTSPGIAPLEPKTLIAAVETLARRVDHVILLLHWGLEYADYPTPEQVQLARLAVDHGASAVLGHHSHSLQGIETYGTGVIAYSLANFTDADVDWQGPTKHYRADLTETDRESVLLQLRVDRHSIRILKTIPLWLDDGGSPTPAEGARGQRIEQQLEAYSARIADCNLEAFWQETIIASRVAAPLKQWWQSGSLWEKIKRFRPGQLVTLYLLTRTYLSLRFSRAESKWLLFNPRNDTRPMPAASKQGKQGSK
jgi:poly-gamma-glutamate synthesis protein (capsule biosynthesis protein)